MSASSVLTLGYGPSGSASKILRLGFSAGAQIVVERPLNLGGYFQPRPQQQKQVVRGAIRISAGGMVRFAGRKVYEGASQEEIAMFLMMSN